MRRRTCVFLFAMVVLGISGLVLCASAYARGIVPVRAKKVRLGTMPASLTLNLNKTSLVPGGTVTASWKVEGRPTGLELWIRAREPGDIETEPGPLAYHPGVRPPTGRIFYLKADRSWDAAPVAYRSVRRLGRAQLRLPNHEEGQWLIEAMLRSTADGSITAYDAVNLLVGSGPEINLRLNRPVANSTDQVSARLITSAGLSPRDIRIAAWLITPDHTQVSLPAFESGLRFLHEGISTNAKYTLLNRPIGPMGPGNYRIQVRMLDGATGALLRMADAGFSICDSPLGTISGTVYDANRQALGGGNPVSAEVQALDIDDGGMAGSMGIGTDGRFAIELPPGRYLLSANVIDSAGRHQAIADRLAVIGCDGGGVTVDLTAGFPAPLDTAFTLSKETSALRLADRAAEHALFNAAQGTCGANACDGFPKPRMFITTTTTNVSGDEADLLTGRFRVQVRDSQRDVNSITESEVRATIQHIILEMQLGTNPGAPVTDLDILSKMVATEFLMVLSFKSDATGKYLIASVLDVKDGSIIRRVESNRIPNSQDFTIEIVDDVAAKVASNPDDAYGRPALFDRLRHEQETPFLPYLKVNLSPAEVQHGGSVTVTAVLREKDAGGALQANRPVTLFHTLPGASTPVRIDGVTDTNGAFVTQLQVGNAPGEGKVNAQFIRRGKVLQDEFASYRVRGTDDLNLSAARAETPAGSSEQVTITLSHFGMPIGGAIVTLSATRGTLDTTTVTTDSNGQATVTFTAGNEGGLANITAQTQLSQTATVSTSMPLAVDSGVDTTLHADANSVYNGVSTQVVSEVLVDGARVPALPVEFSLGGPGTLSADSGVTDENGRISIDYTAPDSGSGSSVVTAVATVDDQEYTRTVTISYGPPQGVCQPPAGASYCVTDLDLGGNSQICARGINNSGQVVGMIGGGGFLWKQGTATTYMTDLLAEDINDAGQVVGRMGTSAVLWQNGSVTNLGSLGGAGGWATAINNAGQVVGYSYEQSDHHAFLWHDGAMQDLGTGVANGINSYGHVVGESTSSTGGAVLWQGGALINLNGSALGSQASDINDAGQIVGQQFRLGELIHATMWDNGSTIDLGSLGSASMAEAINNHGEVVGLAIVSGRWHAFVWKSGVGMQDLNTLIGPNWGWELSRATDINDLGQIVGCSFDQHHIPIRAFLLTPAGR